MERARIAAAKAAAKEEEEAAGPKEETKLPKLPVATSSSSDDGADPELHKLLEAARLRAEARRRSSQLIASPRRSSGGSATDEVAVAAAGNGERSGAEVGGAAAGGRPPLRAPSFEAPILVEDTACTVDDDLPPLPPGGDEASPTKKGGGYSSENIIDNNDNNDDDDDDNDDSLLFLGSPPPIPQSPSPTKSARGSPPATSPPAVPQSVTADADALPELPPDSDDDEGETPITVPVFCLPMSASSPPPAAAPSLPASARDLPLTRDASETDLLDQAEGHGGRTPQSTKIIELEPGLELERGTFVQGNAPSGFIYTLKNGTVKRMQFSISLAGSENIAMGESALERTVECDGGSSSIVGAALVTDVAVPWKIKTKFSWQEVADNAADEGAEGEEDEGNGANAEHGAGGSSKPKTRSILKMTTKAKEFLEIEHSERPERELEAEVSVEDRLEQWSEAPEGLAKRATAPRGKGGGLKALKKLKGRNKTISPSASHRRPMPNVGEEIRAGQEGGTAEATEEDEDELPATPTTPSSPFSMFGPRVGAAGALRGRSSSSAKGPELPPRLPRGASTAMAGASAAAGEAAKFRPVPTNVHTVGDAPQEDEGISTFKFRLKSTHRSNPLWDKKDGN